jgi:hypothetical protein
MSSHLKLRGGPAAFGHRLALIVWAGILAVTTALPAWAQYSFDPNNADEQGPGIKYFGSVKDDRGALIPGASVLIAHTFVLVTDAQGRFRGNVDDGYTADKTVVGCSEPGYKFVRADKRSGPSGGIKQTVQVDCILHKIK